MREDGKRRKSERVRAGPRIDNDLAREAGDGLTSPRAYVRTPPWTPLPGVNSVKGDRVREKGHGASASASGSPPAHADADADTDTDTVSRYRRFRTHEHTHEHGK